MDDLSPEVIDEISEMIFNGQKFQAISLYRSCYSTPQYPRFKAVKKLGIADVAIHVAAEIESQAGSRRLL